MRHTEPRGAQPSSLSASCSSGWVTVDSGSDAGLGRLYRRAWEVADETIAVLPLDAIGRVPWWGERGEVTLHHVLVHMTAETQRHAGHADIVRELIDGAALISRQPKHAACADSLALAVFPIRWFGPQGAAAWPFTPQ